jgi:hypothetical protein
MTPNTMLLMSHALPQIADNGKFIPFSLQNQRLHITTCCTIIYKHNPNANTRSFFLSSIATLIAEIPIQGEKMRENKRREERVKKRKGRRRGERKQRKGVQKKNKSSNLPFSKIHKKIQPTFPLVQVHFTLLLVTNGWENWLLVMALDQGP